MNGATVYGTVNVGLIPTRDSTLREGTLLHTHTWEQVEIKLIPPWPISVQMQVRGNASFEEMHKIVNGYELRILKCARCGDIKTISII